MQVVVRQGQVLGEGAEAADNTENASVGAVIPSTAQTLMTTAARSVDVTDDALSDEAF